MALKFISFNSFVGLIGTPCDKNSGQCQWLSIIVILRTVVTVPVHYNWYTLGKSSAYNRRFPGHSCGSLRRTKDGSENQKLRPERDA